MQVTRIEFDYVLSVAAFYQQLAEKISLPAHFGQNLDCIV